MEPKSEMKLKECIPDNECPKVFEDLPVLFYGAWQDYEESGWQIIFGLEEQLYIEEYRYCVMADSNEYKFDPAEITLEQAKEYASWWRDNPDNDIIIDFLK